MMDPKAVFILFASLFAATSSLYIRSSGDHCSASQIMLEGASCITLLGNILRNHVENPSVSINLPQNLNVTNFCSDVSSALGCMKNLKKTINECGKSSSKTQALSDYVTIMEPAHEYMCQNDGAKIRDFLKNDGSQCIDDKTDALDRCKRIAEPYLTPETRASGMIFGVTGPVCIARNDFQACYVKELKTCPSQTAATFVDELFNYIREHTPCSSVAAQPVVSEN